ncbi:MAG: hypothetical protein GY768_09850 [Planctomycetaceae bacterium]|nr:hypothetical protein [Planctomycetaceae bacterium]
MFSCDSLCYRESLEKCLCELSRVVPPDGQAVFSMCMTPAHPDASQPTTRARSKEMWEQLCSILDGDEEALFVDPKELTRMALQAVQLSENTFSEKGALVESYKYIRKPSPQRLGWSCPETGEAFWSINPIYDVEKRGSTLLLRKRLKPQATPDLKFDSFPDHLELPATRSDERIAWAQQAQILQSITARVYTPDRYWPAPLLHHKSPAIPERKKDCNFLGTTLACYPGSAEAIAHDTPSIF